MNSGTESSDPHSGDDRVGQDGAIAFYFNLEAGGEEELRDVGLHQVHDADVVELKRAEAAVRSIDVPRRPRGGSIEGDDPERSRAVIIPGNARRRP